MEKRRCLKFTGYIYVPDKEAINDPKEMKYWVHKQPGRIQLYDDTGKKMGDKMKAFVTIGQMTAMINKQLQTMWNERFR